MLAGRVGLFLSCRHFSIACFGHFEATAGKLATVIVKWGARVKGGVKG